MRWQRDMQEEMVGGLFVHWQSNMQADRGCVLLVEEMVGGLFVHWQSNMQADRG